MSADALILIYTVCALVVISAVAIYSEIRARRFEPTPSADRIFRCRSCASVYTDDADVDLSRCPQCGAMNEAMKF